VDDELDDELDKHAVLDAEKLELELKTAV